MKTPFLWSGSKDKDFKTLRTYIPTFETYCEPFVGGGSIYFRLLAERGSFKALISDVNADLITTYEVMRDDPEGLIAGLPPTKDKGVFQTLLTSSPTSSVDVAVRFLYLNRNRFFGMGGWMNADRYARDAVIERIRFFSPLMQRTTFSSSGCWHWTSFAPGTFVFCDPPYPETNNAACYGISDDAVLDLNRDYLSFLVDTNADFFWVTKDVPSFRDHAEAVGGLRIERRAWTFRKPGKPPSTAYELYVMRAPPVPTDAFFVFPSQIISNTNTSIHP